MFGRISAAKTLDSKMLFAGEKTGLSKAVPFEVHSLPPISLPPTVRMLYCSGGPVIPMLSAPCHPSLLSTAPSQLEKSRP